MSASAPKSRANPVVGWKRSKRPWHALPRLKGRFSGGLRDDSGLLLAAWPTFAQQTPAQPPGPPAAPPAATPPPWAQGRPDAAIGAQLAPIAPPPIPTAADKLPLDKLNQRT